MKNYLAGLALLLLCLAGASAANARSGYPPPLLYESASDTIIGDTLHLTPLNLDIISEDNWNCINQMFPEYMDSVVVLSANEIDSIGSHCSLDSLTTDSLKRIHVLKLWLTGGDMEVDVDVIKSLSSNHIEINIIKTSFLHADGTSSLALAHRKRVFALPKSSEDTISISITNNTRYYGQGE